MRFRFDSKKIIAAFTVGTFLLTNQSALPLYAATNVPATPALTTEFPKDITVLSLPKSLGKIEDTFQGSTDKTVVIVQDAHAIPDAQKSIEKIIEHFQKNYGVNLVGLEGANSRLDPQIFKSFPDKKLLQKVFKDYLDQGELTGGNGAALFSPFSADFHGVEDWNLYEQGIGLYLAAMKEEKKLNEKLKKEEADLEARKKQIYPGNLLQVDQKLKAFDENKASLVEVLQFLATIQPPAAGTEIAALLAESSPESNDNALDMEVRRIADQVKRALERGGASSTSSSPAGGWSAFGGNASALVGDKRASGRGFPAKESGNDLKMQSFNQKYQEFQTSRISAQAFALFLKELTEKDRLPVMVSRRLSGGMKNQKTMRDIEGTKFFKDFQAYAQSVKDSLMTDDEQKKLDQETRQFEMIKKLSKLELSREDWNELKGRSNVGAPLAGAQGEGQAQGLPLQLFSYHFAFYQNAEKRDRAFLENLMKLLKTSAILVAGGFHAQGLTQRLKEQNISYLLVMPQIDSIPNETHYRDQMRGELSWKSYFEVEDGKINMYKAFVRATRDRLFRESGLGIRGSGVDSRIPYPDSRLLKEWRDQIIRDLADQHQITKAGEYTRFIDEKLSPKTQEKNSFPGMEKINRFIDGLRGLQNQNQLTNENIMKLLTPSAAQTPAGSVLDASASLSNNESSSILAERAVLDVKSQIVKANAPSGSSVTQRGSNSRNLATTASRSQEQRARVKKSSAKSEQRVLSFDRLEKLWGELKAIKEKLKKGEPGKNAELFSQYSLLEAERLSIVLTAKDVIDEVNRLLRDELPRLHQNKNNAIKTTSLGRLRDEIALLAAGLKMDARNPDVNPNHAQIRVVVDKLEAIVNHLTDQATHQAMKDYLKPAAKPESQSLPLGMNPFTIPPKSELQGLEILYEMIHAREKEISDFVPNDRFMNPKTEGTKHDHKLYTDYVSDYAVHFLSGDGLGAWQIYVQNPKDTRMSLSLLSRMAQADKKAVSRPRAIMPPASTEHGLTNQIIEAVINQSESKNRRFILAVYESFGLREWSRLLSSNSARPGDFKRMPEATSREIIDAMIAAARDSGWVVTENVEQQVADLFPFKILTLTARSETRANPRSDEDLRSQLDDAVTAFLASIRKVRGYGGSQAGLNSLADAVSVTRNEVKRLLLFVAPEQLKQASEINVKISEIGSSYASMTYTPEDFEWFSEQIEQLHVSKLAVRETNQRVINGFVLAYLEAVSGHFDRDRVGERWNALLQLTAGKEAYSQGLIAILKDETWDRQFDLKPADINHILGLARSALWRLIESNPEFKGSKAEDVAKAKLPQRPALPDSEIQKYTKIENSPEALLGYLAQKDPVPVHLDFREFNGLTGYQLLAGRISQTFFSRLFGPTIEIKLIDGDRLIVGTIKWGKFKALLRRYVEFVQKERITPSELGFKFSRELDEFGQSLSVIRSESRSNKEQEREGRMRGYFGNYKEFSKLKRNADDQAYLYGQFLLSVKKHAKEERRLRDGSFGYEWSASDSTAPYMESPRGSIFPVLRQSLKNELIQRGYFRSLAFEDLAIKVMGMKRGGLSIAYLERMTEALKELADRAEEGKLDRMEVPVADAKGKIKMVNLKPPAWKLAAYEFLILVNKILVGELGKWVGVAVIGGISFGINLLFGGFFYGSAFFVVALVLKELIKKGTKRYVQALEFAEEAKRYLFRAEVSNFITEIYDTVIDEKTKKKRNFKTDLKEYQGKSLELREIFVMKANSENSAEQKAAVHRGLGMLDLVEKMTYDAFGPAFWYGKAGIRENGKRMINRMAEMSRTLYENEKNNLSYEAISIAIATKAISEIANSGIVDSDFLNRWYPAYLLKWGTVDHVSAFKVLRQLMEGLADSAKKNFDDEIVLEKLGKKQPGASELPTDIEGEPILLKLNLPEKKKVDRNQLDHFFRKLAEMAADKKWNTEQITGILAAVIYLSADRLSDLIEKTKPSKKEKVEVRKHYRTRTVSRSRRLVEKILSGELKDLGLPPALLERWGQMLAAKRKTVISNRILWGLDLKGVTSAEAKAQVDPVIALIEKKIAGEADPEKKEKIEEFLLNRYRTANVIIKFLSGKQSLESIVDRAISSYTRAAQKSELRTKKEILSFVNSKLSTQVLSGQKVVIEAGLFNYVIELSGNTASFQRLRTARSALALGRRDSEGRKRERLPLDRFFTVGRTSGDYTQDDSQLADTHFQFQLRLLSNGNFEITVKHLDSLPGRTTTVGIETPSKLLQRSELDKDAIIRGIEESLKDDEIRRNLSWMALMPWDINNPQADVWKSVFAINSETGQVIKNFKPDYWGTAIVPLGQIYADVVSKGNGDLTIQEIRRSEARSSQHRFKEGDVLQAPSGQTWKVSKVVSPQESQTGVVLDLGTNRLSSPQEPKTEFHYLLEPLNSVTARGSETQPIIPATLRQEYLESKILDWTLQRPFAEVVLERFNELYNQESTDKRIEYLEVYKTAAVKIIELLDSRIKWLQTQERIEGPIARFFPDPIEWAMGERSQWAGKLSWGEKPKGLLTLIAREISGEFLKAGGLKFIGVNMAIASTEIIEARKKIDPLFADMNASLQKIKSQARKEKSEQATKLYNQALEQVKAEDLPAAKKSLESLIALMKDDLMNGPPLIDRLITEIEDSQSEKIAGLKAKYQLSPQASLETLIGVSAKRSRNDFSYVIELEDILKLRSETRMTERTFNYPAGKFNAIVKNLDQNQVSTSEGMISVGMSMLNRNLANGEADKFPNIFLTPVGPWTAEDGSSLVQFYFAVAANWNFHKRKTKIIVKDQSERDRIYRYLQLGNPYELPKVPGYEYDDTWYQRFRREAIALADRGEIDGKLQIITPEDHMVEFVIMKEDTAQIGDVTITLDREKKTYGIKDKGTVTELAGANLKGFDVKVDQVQPLIEKPEFGLTLLGTSGGMDINGLTSNAIVWAGKKGILQDAGAPTVSLLTSLGITPKDIDSLIITHMHEDHVAGALQFFEWMKAGNKELNLIIEPGIYQFFKEQMELILKDKLENVYPNIRFVPSKFYEEVVLGDGEDEIRFKAIPAFHGTPTASYRIDFRGKAISLSSDTTIAPLRLDAFSKAGLPGIRDEIKEDLKKLSDWKEDQALFAEDRRNEIQTKLFEAAAGIKPSYVLMEAGYGKPTAITDLTNHTYAGDLKIYPKADQELIVTNHASGLPANEILPFQHAVPLQTLWVLPKRSESRPIPVPESGVRSEQRKEVTRELAGRIAAHVLGVKKIPDLQMTADNVRKDIIILGINEFARIVEQAAKDLILERKTRALKEEGANPDEIAKDEEMANRAIELLLRNFKLSVEGAVAITFNMKGKELLLKQALQKFPGKNHLLALLANGTLSIDVSGLKEAKVGDIAHQRPSSYIKGIEITNSNIVLAIQAPENAVALTKPNTIDITSAAPKSPDQKKAFGAFDEIVDQVFRTVVAANAGVLLENAAQLQASETKKDLVQRLLKGEKISEWSREQINNADAMIDIQGGKIIVNPAMLRLLTEYLARSEVRKAA